MIIRDTSYNYGGYNYRISSQTFETTSKRFSYKKLKLPLLCGTFGPYDYEAREQKVESLFYFYCVKEEEKFQLVLKSLSYEVNVRWNCKCENRKRMGAHPVQTWSLMKQSLRNKFGVENHERQRNVQVEEKGMVITNPTRCFKCNGVGRIAINCPTKRVLVFSEDLNGWIEKSDDYSKKVLLTKMKVVKTKRLPILKLMRRVYPS
ncbi:hypothetical protein M9H77_08886 [Catharanthus roseus]|uniref:Uncharacterized protein n=1 Tax=Catharanthus roseus TaxID=4058 RepID=A0ACC0BZG1_CATRO|nr:hypothetical protein M9H77_08886 [Catharanthus roseus]